ncbi:MAG: aspartyl-tRNA amidotransferase, partial [Chloroflexi bacterium RBG_16_58_8]
MEQESALKQKFSEDLKQAMKAGETVRRDTLRMLIASVNNAGMAKQAALTDADVLGVVAKEVKRHQESIDAFKKGNRADLVAKEQAEMAILQAYLPRQLTRDEIIAAAKEVIAAVGAKGPGDKGKVMQQLMPILKGRAEGKDINDVV